MGQPRTGLAIDSLIFHCVWLLLLWNGQVLNIILRNNSSCAPCTSKSTLSRISRKGRVMRATWILRQLAFGSSCPVLHAGYNPCNLLINAGLDSQLEARFAFTNDLPACKHVALGLMQGEMCVQYQYFIHTRAVLVFHLYTYVKLRTCPT